LLETAEKSMLRAARRFTSFAGEQAFELDMSAASRVSGV